MFSFVQIFVMNGYNMHVWFVLSLGLSIFIDSNLCGFGQCGNVEHKISKLGTPILGTAVLFQSFLTS